MSTAPSSRPQGALPCQRFGSTARNSWVRSPVRRSKRPSRVPWLARDRECSILPCVNIGEEANVIPRLPCVLGAVLAAAAATGCASHEYVRGTHDPGIDRPAMSTGLDKDDIERTLQTLLNQMRDAPIMTEWRTRAGQ